MDETAQITEESNQNAGQAPVPLKLNVKRTVLVGVAFLTICMFWQAYNTLMPLYLDSLGFMQWQYSLVMSLDKVLAVTLMPFTGVISDLLPIKIRSKFGRRIPFIICGTLLAAVALMFINLGYAMRSIPLMLSMSVFALIIMSLYRSPAVALMPDVTPKQKRSGANAIINVMGVVGGIVFLALSMIFREKADDTSFRQNNWVLLGIVAALMVTAAVIMIIKIKENRFVEEKLKQLRDAGIDDDSEYQKGKSEKVKISEILSALKKPQLISLLLLLSSVFLWYMGYNAVVVHFPVFSEKFLGMEFELPLIIAQVAGAAMFVPSVMLGKKIGRKNTILIGLGLMFIGFTIGTAVIFGTDNPEVFKICMYPVFVFVGGGWATINVHSFVMSVEFSTEKTVGAYTGLYYIFAMGAQSLGAILAGLLNDYVHAASFLPYALVFVVLATATMLFVRHGNSADKPIEPILKAQEK